MSSDNSNRILIGSSFSQKVKYTNQRSRLLCQNGCNGLCSLFVVLLSLFCCMQPMHAQSLDDSSQTDDQLPENAIWQFGNPESAHSGFYKLVFSHDGKFLAARNSRNVVTVYDAETHQPLDEFEGHDQPVQCIDFSKDGKYLLTGAHGQRDDQQLEHTKIWNLKTGELQLDLKIQAFAAFFSPQGEDVLILDEDVVHKVRITDGKTVFKRVWKRQNEKPLTMSRDGNRIAYYRNPVAGRLYNLSVLDLRSQTTTTLPGNATLPREARFSDNNLYLAAIFNRDENAYLWDLRTKTQFALSGHSERTTSIAFSADSRFLASTSLDDTAIVWDLLTRQKISGIKFHRDNVNSVAFSPLDAQFATGASGKVDNRGIVWNLNSILFPVTQSRGADPKDANAFKHLWIRMSARPPQHALIAMRQLTLGGIELLGFLEKKIGVSTIQINQKEIAEWIVSLDSMTYAERERASAALKELGPHVLSLADRALENATTAEVRYRIQKLLRQPIIRPPSDPQELCRIHRSIMALEMMARGDANLDLKESKVLADRAVFALQTLALGHENIDVANDAQSALDRIALRLKSAK